MTGVPLDLVRGLLRAVTLMEAAERASLTPIPVQRLHALAYLADILSPVWGLAPFDKVALKTDKTPFFGQFQTQIDTLVLQGLIVVAEYGVSIRGDSIAPPATLSFRYESAHLSKVLAFISDDPEFSEVLKYSTYLAVAMSRMSDAAIAEAASFDATWENPDIPAGELVEITGILGGRTRTPTDETLELFEHLKNSAITTSPGAKLRLYATYLSERLNVA